MEISELNKVPSLVMSNPETLEISTKNMRFLDGDSERQDQDTYSQSSKSNLVYFLIFYSFFSCKFFEAEKF